MSSTNTSTDSSQQSPDIVEVYSSNFLQELKRISVLLEQFPYIGMDTEFPGIVYPLPEYTPDFYYRNIKLNVNSLKLIQLGITLSDAKGKFPKGTHTWQFNFKFSLSRDKISSESLSLLTGCGINFSLLSSEGIDHTTFAEYLITSGLVLNNNVHWISFHGSFDFAYLLRLLLNDVLPDSENEFTSLLSLYFPNHYDIRIICQSNDKLIGGLNRVAMVLNVKRIGEVHQAGSDAYVTVSAFHRIRNDSIVEKDVIDGSVNVLYGLGLGADDGETIHYIKFVGNHYGNEYTYTYANMGNYYERDMYYQMQMQGHINEMI